MLPNTAALLSRLAQLRGLRVTAGIQAEEGAAAAQDDEGPVTVLKKAIWLEFGTKRKGQEEGEFHSPPRPFLRSTLARYRRDWTESLRKRVRLSLRGHAGLTPEAVALRTGNEMRVGIQTQMDSAVPPFIENAQSTKDAKRSSQPTIDTTQTQNSLRFAAYLGDTEVGRG